MRIETAEEYMQNTYLSNMKYISVPRANFSIKNNIFWYVPYLLLLDHKSNWIDDKLEHLQSIEPLHVLNSGLITLDVSFSLYDEKGNLLYDSTYYGLKVGNNLKAQWIFSPISYLKSRKYYGVSFAFPFLHSRKYHVYLNELWHIGEIEFTHQIPFQINILKDLNKHNFEIGNNMILNLDKWLEYKDKQYISNLDNVRVTDKNVKIVKSNIKKQIPSIGMQTFSWYCNPLNTGIRLDPLNSIAYLSSIGVPNKSIFKALNLVSNQNTDFNKKAILAARFINTDNKFNKDFLSANLRAISYTTNSYKGKSSIVQFHYNNNSIIRNLSPYEVISFKRYYHPLIFGDIPQNDLQELGLNIKLPSLFSI